MNRDSSIESLDHGIEREYVRCDGWLAQNMALTESSYPRKLLPLRSLQVQTFQSCRVTPHIPRRDMGRCLSDRDLSGLWGSRDAEARLILRILCLRCTVAEYEPSSQKGLQGRRLSLFSEDLILTIRGRRQVALYDPGEWLTEVRDQSSLLNMTPSSTYNV